MAEQTIKRRRLKGIVASTKMMDTVVVRVDTVRTHSKFRMQSKMSRRYQAHAPGHKYQEGEWVVIEECRPMSKNKKWRVVSTIKK